jgi:hypothetical protein
LVGLLVFILISALASAEQYKQIVIATGGPFEFRLILEI